MRPWHIVGGIVLLLALALGGWALAGSLTPYVTVAEARATGRAVQVRGHLQGAASYDAAGHLRFVLVDEQGDEMVVVYPRPQPANMDPAAGLVVVGRYDPAAGLFRASRILVKCPSRYEEPPAPGGAP